MVKIWENLEKIRRGLGIFDCWLWKEEQSQTCNGLGGSYSWVSQKKERKKKPFLKCKIADAARSSMRSHGTEFIFKPKRGLAKHKRGIFFCLKVMRPLLSFPFHCATLLLRSAFKKQPRLLLKQIFKVCLCPFHMYVAKWHGGQSLEPKMARKKNKVQGGKNSETVHNSSLHPPVCKYPKKQSRRFGRFRLARQLFITHTLGNFLRQTKITADKMQK